MSRNICCVCLRDCSVYGCSYPSTRDNHHCRFTVNLTPGVTPIMSTCGIIIVSQTRACEVDVDGIVDDKGIQYIGKATKQDNGRWLCLAAIGEALCRVEVSITFQEKKQAQSL